jgi:uroporphyrinogen decarboxylase
VPLFLLATMHGAKETGLGLKEYFSKAENVVEGQLKLLSRFHSDCAYPFFYAALETEAWGGETIFRDDGPPNAGAPVIADPETIMRVEPPPVTSSPGLLRALETIQGLKARLGSATPILGVVMSPFSLPVMQMGFEQYLDLIHERPALLERLLAVNSEFCVAWANAQLEAGATAICYFDPVSSPTIVTPELFARYGLPSAQRAIARFKGPTAVHFASGRCLSIIEQVARSGTLAVGVSAEEDLSELKAACRGKLTVVGNMNGIEMRRWTTAQAETIVKEAIVKAGKGGGFILADNHGEIPFQVPDEVLLAVSEAVERWGRYPLAWLENNHG